MSSLLLILLSAVLVSIAVLTSAPQWRPFTGVTDTYGGARAMALTSLLIIPAVTVLCWLTATFMLVPWDLQYLRTLAFVSILLIVVSAAEFALRRFTAIEPQRPGFGLLMTTNAAALGAALLAQIRLRSAFEALLSSIGAAAALGLLLVAFASLHERLQSADAPRPFRETPLALVTAGLIALGFMGLTGLLQE
jgi:electron transport complex protein RnfA